MTEELAIFLSDLTPEVQARVLRFLKIKAAEELNLDVFPLFVLPKAIKKDIEQRAMSKT